MLDGVHARLHDRGQGAGLRAETEMDHSDAARELHRLLDVLLATRGELSEGVMPRAARITGTSQQLAQVISRIEVAIRAARGLLEMHECSATSADGQCGFDVTLEALHEFDTVVGVRSDNRGKPIYGT